jgi:peroxiredoxin
MGMAETPSTFMLRPGDPAPDFELPDFSGTRHRLAELAGPRGMLVVFVCNHCPYVIHLADRLGELAAEWKERGVGTVAISSNDVEHYPQDAPEHMATFATEHGWDFPYLYDETQDVAKAYGAACTPDFFLFGPERKLFYAGQFDDSRPKNGRSATGEDLGRAVDALVRQEDAAPAASPSTGCNIKWKPGQEPAWFG